MKNKRIVLLVLIIILILIIIGSYVIVTKETYNNKLKISSQNEIKENTNIKDSNNTINNFTNNIEQQENIEESSKERVFGKEDNKIGKIKLGMTESEVKAKLGEPLNIYYSNDGEFYMEEKHRFVYEYEGNLNIAFRAENGKNIVYLINTYKPEDEGPRGIKVGDTKDTVIESFYYNDNMFIRDKYTKELYRINEGEYCGFIIENDIGINIQYSGDKLNFDIFLDKNGIVKGMTLTESLY